MNLTKLLPGCLLALLCACGGGHFISDPARRAQTETDLRTKLAYFEGQLPLPADAGAGTPEYWGKMCGEQLDSREAGAMTFLYAYMPVSDILMKEPAYWLAQVRAAFEAQRTFAWGEQVPELLFRHFVLPPRVNNEDLDSCRTAFMAELQPRLAGLTMTQAALEVNHWCHEKVIYTPTDGRTGSPLEVVARAYGRCGEESTFAVAALRSVGIPARQVYTPRWAHTDDNHAWVEVWADGAWHYMGACEPEPVLDRAWFTSAAKRAMLATTFVFGRYAGPEEMLAQNECYTEVNVLPTYAPTKQAVVKVTDTAGRPVEGAAVEFGLYNYAEFYPLAKRATDTDGLARLTTGLGTLVIQAVKGDMACVESYSVPGIDTLHLVLRPLPLQGEAHYRLTPPPEGVMEAISDEDAQRHALRLQREDSIRMAYTATFPFVSFDTAAKFAEESGLEEGIAVPLLQRSANNGAQVAQFLRETAPANRPLALDLLSVLPEKDLRQVPASTLRDHLDGILALGDRYDHSPLHRQWLLQPRVDNELITPWRTLLCNAAASIPATNAETLEFVRGWLGRLHDAGPYNPRGFTQYPAATLRGTVADPRSRVVFGVAMLRALGVPARIDPVTGQFEACVDGTWQPVETPTDAEVSADASLRITYGPQDGIGEPKYETHYTLGQWTGKRFRTLGLDGGKGDIAGGSLALHVPAGDYRMVTGRRLLDGTVLARVDYFPAEAGKQTLNVPLLFENAGGELAVVGSINPEGHYMPADATETCSILQTTGRGLFILLVMDAAKEPSRHLAGDLMASARDIDAAGLPVVCIFRDEPSLRNFRNAGHQGLPAMHYGYDPDGNLCRQLAASLERPGLDADLPLVVVADSFGRVFYCSLGYRINLGETLVGICKTIAKK